MLTGFLISLIAYFIFTYISKPKSTRSGHVGGPPKIPERSGCGQKQHHNIYIKRVEVLNICETSANSNKQGVQLTWDSSRLEFYSAVPGNDRTKRSGMDSVAEDSDVTQQLKKLKQQEEQCRETTSAVIQTLLGKNQVLRKKSKAEQDIREQMEEKVVTFVLELERRDQQISHDVISKLEDRRLREVAIQLVEKYQVRLLAIDCGLNVKMDVPTNRWPNINSGIGEIKRDLKSLLSDNEQSTLRWRAPVPCLSVKEETSPSPFKPELPIQAIGSKNRRTSFSKPIPVSSPDDPAHPVSKRPGTLPLRDISATRTTKESPDEISVFDDCCHEGPGSDRDRNYILRLKAKIRQLEDELGQTKKRAGTSGHGLRRDEDRLITLSVPFKIRERHSDVSIRLANTPVQVKPQNVGLVAKRLQEKLHVKATGVFYPISDDDTSPVIPAFILQTSVADRTMVKNRQPELQAALAQLLPCEQSDITWMEMKLGSMHCDSEKSLSP